MPEHLTWIVTAAIVGCGLITGLLFAFSLVVMRALDEQPAATAARVMQRINVLIVNRLFLAVFLGTALLCVAVIVVGVRGATPGGWWLAGGALAYLAGPIGVTIAFNVPLNDRLARAAEQGGAEWPAYQRAWLRWNHLRTLLGALALALMAFGLGRGGA